MPSPIRILAAAPVRHVPAKSRLMRTSYAPVYEDIALRELSLSEAPRGPTLPVNGGKTVRTRIVDNEIWRPIGSNDAEGPDALDGATFRRWLEGTEDTVALGTGALGRCFEGTPLLARIPGQRESLRPGGLWNTERQGTLILDTRDRMPGIVRDYVGANVATIDGMPFMRMPGPMAYVTTATRTRDRLGHPSLFRVQLLNHAGGWTTNSAINLSNVYRADTIVHDLNRVEVVNSHELKLGWKPAALDGFTMRDDDVVIMLRESIRIIASNAPRDGFALDKARCEEFEDHVALGSVGAIRDEDIPAAWRFVRDFAKAIDTIPEVGWVRQEAKRIANYADWFALKRSMRIPVQASEDIESLSGLSPM